MKRRIEDLPRCNAHEAERIGILGDKGADGQFVIGYGSTIVDAIINAGITCGTCDYRTDVSKKYEAYRCDITHHDFENINHFCAHHSIITK